MTIQLHLTGAKAAVTIAANLAAAQEAAKAGGAKPKIKPVPWSGFSGRGVRLRLLDQDEKEMAHEFAAKGVGEDGTLGALITRRNREVLYRCVVEVTKERELSDLVGTAWIKVTQLDLEGSGPLSAAKLFTPKDLDVLRSWARDNHDASAADLEAVTGEGKAVEVEDGAA